MTDPANRTPCGPGEHLCGRWLELYGDTHISCPNHADACSAGPYMLAARETFKATVLKILKRDIHQYQELMRGNKIPKAGADQAIMALALTYEAIRDLPTGMLDDSRRMAKGK